jgi:hypothetical protein
MFYVKLLKNESFFVCLNTVCYAKNGYNTLNKYYERRCDETNTKKKVEKRKNTSMDGKMHMFTLDNDIFNVSSNSFER